MEISLSHKTYRSYGGHDYLSMIKLLLNAKDFFAGKAIQRLEVNVNFKPREHVLLMYDAVNNRVKEKPDYLFQRRKKTLKIIYLSMVSTLEEEEAYFRGQTLEAEKFNELCYELRDYLEGIEHVLKPDDDFNLNAFLEFVDTRFNILPIAESKLNSMFEEYQEETRLFYEEWDKKLDSKFNSTKTVRDRPNYWDENEKIDSTKDNTASFPIEKISWLYGDKQYLDLNEFIEELNNYNWKVSDCDDPIKDFELISSNRALVRFIGKGKNENECSDKEIEIVSSNKNFSFLEFLFITNNKLFEYLIEADEVYYEGYEFLEEKSSIPVIQLIQGS